MNNPPRLVIYAKDVMHITGKQERAAYRLLARIRKHLGKKPHEFISIDDFCTYTGLKHDKVEKFLH